MKHLISALVGLGASTALAQTTVVSTTTAGRAQSARSQALEIKLGSILPMIDDDDALTGNPYEETFDGGMLLLEVELERYLYQGIGAAGVGFSAGYAEKYGRATVIDESGNPAGPAAEATGLMIVPLRLHGVYRFDWAALKYGVPLVPYAKAGLVVVPWWSTKGGKIEEVNGEQAMGARFGYGGTVGLSLMLDVFEPRLARDFDSDLGVNHSYLFAEYTYANVRNFGNEGLNLSSRHWMFGLALEF